MKLPTDEVARQQRLYPYDSAPPRTYRRFMQTGQMLVIAVLILVVVGPTAAKGIANLAHFNAENGRFPHD